MGKKKKEQASFSRKKVDANEMAGEIRRELRSILRRLDGLRKPLVPRLVEELPSDTPRYYVEHASFYEALQEDVITLAGMVWHLKDRLRRWMSASNLASIPTIEEVANSEIVLQICGDLIDSKKHGGGTNRSGYAPQVGAVSISPNGRIAFRYDGALRAGEILTENSKPIPVEIRIESGDGKYHFGPAIDLITKAFEIWKRLIEKTGLLDGELPENSELRRLLVRFDRREHPIFQSNMTSIW